jgi:hypothetical protein
MVINVVFKFGPVELLVEWLMMTFVLENCLLDLFVVLDLNLRSILIDNSFFFVSRLSKIGNKYYLFYLFLTTV